ncbi:hypothetical protein [Flexivirga caeni]|uniref:FUSC family protein n=1 Tax=Flexivirga caeni TaxID=2294115 RepID=A0A3M9MHP0_9MICO|nr:hypothetical protein [Flexivirga caeni]RNI24695.1 hypothetical protein EFY87_03050 [Flexivirga caeni]
MQGSQPAGGTSPPTWRTPRAWLPVAFAAAMVAAAQLSGQRAVVFPEGAALAFGAWVMWHPQWIVPRWRLVATPTCCAVAGVGMARLLPARLAAEVAALACATVVLLVLRSQIAPALSAATLPTVFGIRSWVYPVAVLAIATVMVVGVTLQARATPGHPARAEPSAPGGRWPVSGFLCYAALAAAWFGAAAALHLPSVAVAPPLAVSGLEWFFEHPRSVRVGAGRALLLGLAWAIGSAAVWHLPAVLAAVLATSCALVLMLTLSLRCAPVLAMALVAQIAGPVRSWTGTARDAGLIVASVVVLYLAAAVAARLWRRRPGSSPGG